MKTVAIIGAGPAGLFAAYNLCQKKKFKVLVFDKGKDIYHRICPMRDGKPCANCKPCNIMCGFGGAGSFSDSKLSLSPFGVGGDTVDYLGAEKTLGYIKQVEDIFTWFDEDSSERKIIGQKTDKYNEIEAKLKTQDLDLTYCPTKHLGTDGTLKIMKSMYEYLKSNNVNFFFNTEIIDFRENDSVDCRHTLYGKYTLYAKLASFYVDYIIFAPGRSGNAWLKDTMNKHNVKSVSKKYDIGYRVEVPANIIKELTDNLYDMKISYTYKDGPYQGMKVRTFCTNPNGFVSEEKYDGNIALANGHSYANKKSNNTNFAVLVTIEGNAKIGHAVVKKFNDSVGNNVIVNNFNYAFHNKDKGVFDTLPTLNVECTKQVARYTPRHMNFAVVDFLHRLDAVYPGIIANTTNIYGMEAKFYSDTIEVKNNLETSIPNIYCAGDGSGITRGIVQSACNGLAITDDIISKEQ